MLQLLFDKKDKFTFTRSRIAICGIEKSLEKMSCEQECIPVGCVPPAVVAVSPATHAPLPCTPLLSPPHTPPFAAHAPTVNRITDTCENITFPQLRLRAVITHLIRTRRQDQSEQLPLGTVVEPGSGYDIGPIARLLIGTVRQWAHHHMRIHQLCRLKETFGVF